MNGRMNGAPASRSTIRSGCAIRISWRRILSTTTPTRSEIGIRDIAAERIARSRAEYIANPDVRRHFRDPAKAWDEAFRLNDGGVTYLANSIAPICNPMIKINQISARLALQRRTMIERLQRYYVTDDLAEQRERRRAAAAQVIEHLIRCASNQRFGGLIRALQITDAELSDVFFALETRPDRERTFGSAVDEDTLRKLAGLSTGQSQGNGASDTADQYASAVVTHWIDVMRSAATNSRVCRYFHVPDNVMSDLVDELIAGASRIDLRRQVAAQIRPAIIPQARLKEAVVKPALLAADAIGAFVMWLGYASVRPASALPGEMSPTIAFFNRARQWTFPNCRSGRRVSTAVFMATGSTPISLSSTTMRRASRASASMSSRTAAWAPSCRR